MPEAGEKRTIAVWILGQEYRIRSDAEESTVQKAAAFVDETMTMIRERTGAVDSLNIAVLAALNIANHLIALREKPGAEHDTEPISAEQVQDLLELVQSVSSAELGKGA